MTDSVATKRDLSDLEARIAARFTAIDARFDQQEKHLDLRLAELEKRFELRFATRADLTEMERRLTMRMGAMMLAGITVVSVLAELL